jgi:hypothetical protein
MNTPTPPDLDLDALDELPALFGEGKPLVLNAEQFRNLMAAARTLQNLRDGQECDGFRLVPAVKGLCDLCGEGPQKFEHAHGTPAHLRICATCNGTLFRKEILQ